MDTNLETTRKERKSPLMHFHSVPMRSVFPKPREISSVKRLCYNNTGILKNCVPEMPKKRLHFLKGSLPSTFRTVVSCVRGMRFTREISGWEALPAEPWSPFGNSAIVENLPKSPSSTTDAVSASPCSMQERRSAQNSKLKSVGDD